MIIERSALNGDLGDVHTITINEWELRAILRSFFQAKGISTTKYAVFVVKDEENAGHSVTLREYSAEFRGLRPKKGAV